MTLARLNTQSKAKLETIFWNSICSMLSPEALQAAQEDNENGFEVYEGLGKDIEAIRDDFMQNLRRQEVRKYLTESGMCVYRFVNEQNKEIPRLEWMKGAPEKLVFDCLSHCLLLLAKRKNKRKLKLITSLLLRALLASQHEIELLAEALVAIEVRGESVESSGLSEFLDKIGATLVQAILAPNWADKLTEQPEQNVPLST